MFYEDDEDNMYDYFPGEYILGDEVYVEEEYLDEKWWYTNDPDYMISSYGRVYSVRKHKILKPKRGDKHGHLNVRIHDKYPYLHRLTAKAFVPNPYNLPYVRHKNDVPDDNYYCNLVWGTQKDNIRDCINNDHFYYITDEDREKGLREVRTPVLATNIKTGEQIRFNSQQEAAKYLGVQQANLFKVLKGQRAHSRGWFFEYLPKEY